MRLSHLLYSQGFGTRRACTDRVLAGTVSIGGRVCDDPEEDIDTTGLTFTVDGVDWPFHARALVLLHKPAGYECSAQPRHHPSVATLLPWPLRARGVQPVGRLDADTTGLLLLTDDGPLIHALTSPRRKVPKVYEVRTRHPVDQAQAAALACGVVLRDDPDPARASDVAITGTQVRYPAMEFTTSGAPMLTSIASNRPSTSSGSAASTAKEAAPVSAHSAASLRAKR